jgi:ATP-dependent Clp protease ATP-binding subunit ClpC
LVRDRTNLAARILKRRGIDLKVVRAEVAKFVENGPAQIKSRGRLPHTPRTKKIIEHSIDEARKLNHEYVGPEHVLLGLIREREGVAAHVLISLGVDLEALREEIVRALAD